ncbi:uncharacterized protein LOC132563600 [Ylistrum balloti]|uniref:uncharacterized protein LOC132563600 n=1 Tax=Ylistrum balloti TaxID=509963 RepID=UPI002905B63D|nr:uncharacterized protein LOC132563600 [Ylistrum balloti]
MAATTQKEACHGYESAGRHSRLLLLQEEEDESYDQKSLAEQARGLDERFHTAKSHFKDRVLYLGMFVQAIWRLYNEVTKKTATLGRIDSKTPEFVEIKLLWEKCGDEIPILARSACQVLVRLVTDGNADILFILNGLLNQVPSARSLLGIVNGIGELLVLQIALTENQCQMYLCPYRLRVMALELHDSGNFCKKGRDFRPPVTNPSKLGGAVG